MTCEAEQDRPCIVNFSGGKDSTFMLLEMIRRGMRIDLVLNADTGMEFPAMYDHIDRIDAFLQAERGIKITRLKNEQSFEELMFDAVRKGNKPGYGWPCAVVRWCTGQLKTHLIAQFCRTFPMKPYHFVALASDEQYRLKRKGNQGKDKKYPLVEWGITEAQALAGCYQAGYTWDGLYEQFSRVSCWCCPLQSLKELRILREFHPELWETLRRIDDRAIAQFGRNNAYGTFRPKESVRMLEVRFDFEKQWAEAGGKTNTKAFYRALNLRYQDYFTSIGEPYPYGDSRVAELLAYLEADKSGVQAAGGKVKNTPHRKNEEILVR